MMNPVEFLRLQKEAEKAYYAQQSSTNKAGLRKSTILGVCSPDKQVWVVVLDLPEVTRGKVALLTTPDGVVHL
jgi:hypothetical protein